VTDLLPVLPAFLLAVLVVSGAVLLGLGVRVALEPRA
jgi:hypothetical protein